MNPIEAMIFRDDYYKMLQEKERGKESPDLENVLTEKLMNTYLREVEEEANLRKMLKRKNF
jgi:hypothetical protein